MNGLDIAFAVVTIFYVLRGIFRGFIKEATSIAGVVLGFVLASRYYPIVSEAVKPLIQNPSYRNTIGFLALFLCIFIIISILGVLLNMLFRLALSRVTDGLLGAFIAFCKGVALTSVVLMATTAFISPESSFYQESRTWPYLQLISERLKATIPPSLREALEYKIDIIKPLVEGATGEDRPMTPKDDAPDGDQTPPPWKPVPSETTDSPAPAWPGSSGSDQSNSQ